MTKQEAAEKIAKLRRLARGTQNPNETNSANQQADRLAAEYHVDERASRECDAFDEVMASLQNYASSKLSSQVPSLFSMSTVLGEVGTQLSSLSSEDKSKRLRQIAKTLSVASLFVGDHRIVSDIKNIVDTTLKKYEITL